MVIRCIVCNSKDVDLKIRPALRDMKFKPFCSRECELIHHFKIYAFAGIFLLIVPPFGIYLWVKAFNGFSYKMKRKKLQRRARHLCFHCGKEVETSTKLKTICMHCGEIVHYCDLCQAHILFKEEILQIEPCGHLFHRDELLEWTEKNDICPKCSVKIEFVDFQPD